MNRETRPSLLERLREGEEPLAWQEFLAIYGHPMYACARRRGCSEATAQDIVQDAVLAVYQNMTVFQYDPSRGRFISWLFKVVEQKVALRRRRKRPVIGLDDHNLDTNRPTEQPVAPDEIFQKDFELALWAALLATVRKTTEPTTYQAFELVTLHGMSGEEAASITGLPTASAVYSAKRRVVNKLMELSSNYRETGKLDTTLRHAMQHISSLPLQAVTQKIQSSLK